MGSQIGSLCICESKPFQELFRVAASIQHLDEETSSTSHNSERSVPLYKTGKCYGSQSYCGLRHANDEQIRGRFLSTTGEKVENRCCKNFDVTTGAGENSTIWKRGSYSSSGRQG